MGRAPVKNKKILSFTGGEDSNSDDDGAAVSAGTGKSAHDLLNDPKLLKGASSKSVIEEVKRRSTNTDEKRGSKGAGNDSKADKVRQKAAKKEMKKADSDSDSDASSGDGSQ